MALNILRRNVYKKQSRTRRHIQRLYDARFPINVRDSSWLTVSGLGTKMKHLRPSLLGIVTFLAFLVGGCGKKDASPQWIDPAKISQGPVVHAKLSEDQLARIGRLQKTFAEVDPTPLEKWIEDFTRDQDPDREIRIWEGMAQPYEAFTAKHTLTPQGKKEAYQVVMLRSGASESETLRHLKLQVLTKDDAKEILAVYREAPEPIRVYTK